MSIQKLTIFAIISLVCSLSINAQTEKKSAYKKFVEVFDKATTKLEEEAPKKIEKGLKAFTDNLEDFENDIHAEPKKQSKFAKLFNYIADINIAETCANDFVHITAVQEKQRVFKVCNLW